MIDTVICDFCHWQGTVDIDSNQCPHCQESGHLVPENEYVIDENNTVKDCRPDNMQAIYGVVMEINQDAPPIK